MYTSLDFKRAYTDYVQQYKEYLANMSMAGKALDMFGFKPRGSGSGFEEFFSEMKSAMAAVCEEGPDSETADGIADVIFNARDLYADENIPEIQFIAIEGTTADLIPFLSHNKAVRLCEIYTGMYPKYRRLPVQKQLVKALEKAAGK